MKLYKKVRNLTSRNNFLYYFTYEKLFSQHLQTTGRSFFLHLLHTSITLILTQTTSLLYEDEEKKNTSFLIFFLFHKK